MSFVRKILIITFILIEGFFSDAKALKIENISENQTLSPITSTIDLEKHYFLPIEEKSIVRKIFEETLFFSFKEEYKITGEAQLSLFDGHRNFLSNINIELNFGVNYYELDLTSIGHAFQLDELYEISYGRKSLKFIIEEAPEKTLPEANIVVNAISIGCDDNEVPNLVEFYGEILSGNPPYELTWFIFTDASRQVPLRAPNKQTLQFEGEIGMMALEDPLNYTVVLAVLDACGQYEEGTVNLICGEGESDGVTVFVENTNNQSGGSGNIE